MAKRRSGSGNDGDEHEGEGPSFHAPSRPSDVDQSKGKTPHEKPSDSVDALFNALESAKKKKRSRLFGGGDRDRPDGEQDGREESFPVKRLLLFFLGFAIIAVGSVAAIKYIQERADETTRAVEGGRPTGSQNPAGQEPQINERESSLQKKIMGLTKPSAPAPRRPRKAAPPRRRPPAPQPIIQESPPESESPKKRSRPKEDDLDDRRELFEDPDIIDREELRDAEDDEAANEEAAEEEEEDEEDGEFDDPAGEEEEAEDY